MDLLARSHVLRNGRYSELGRIYLITTITEQRRPVFADWRLGRLLAQTLRQSDAEGRSQTLAWVVMPDHLHWLMALRNGADLAGTMRWVKGVSARKIGLASRLPIRVWQPGYHDHAVRREEDLLAMARYVVANPLRKKLVQRIGDYPLWDAVWL